MTRTARYLHIQIYLRLRRYVAGEWHSLHPELQALIAAGMWIDVIMMRAKSKEHYAGNGSLCLNLPISDQHRRILAEYLQGETLVVPPASDETRYAVDSPTHFEGEIWLTDTSDFCTIVKALHTELGFEIALGTTSGELFVD
jgi:hypothetical protein